MKEIQSLTTKILMASRPHCPDVSLLAFLSELGELDDKGREQVLETARIAYDNHIETQCPSAWDYGCYRD
tara:strand:+ start:2054 stop:2263 length:210 start_codon:yes stop_codon:yes gene_type:complete